MTSRIQIKRVDGERFFRAARLGRAVHSGGPPWVSVRFKRWGVIVRMKAFIVTISLLLSGVVFADTQGKVHPEPTTASCPDFKRHQLCFDLPKDGIARGEYFSEPFYAIILKTTKPCTISEKERLQTQALFPRSKVFSVRFGCVNDFEESIRYTNVNDKFGFLAVHAGATVKEAKTRLTQVKATGKFPDANLRKMQAVLVFP